MYRDFVNLTCGTFPGATNSDPWGGGHDVWKVGGKMFASVGAKTPGVSVKTDSIETAETLIDLGLGSKAPYLHRSWILLSFDAGEDEILHRLKTSYKIIRGGLTKKARSELGAIK